MPVPGYGLAFRPCPGLQQKSERAIWRSLVPITIGHTVSIVQVTTLVLAAGHLISIAALRFMTAGTGTLLAVGLHMLTMLLVMAIITLTSSRF